MGVAVEAMSKELQEYKSKLIVKTPTTINIVSYINIFRLLEIWNIYQDTK